MEIASTSETVFEEAADAVVSGDLAGLGRLLDAEPELARARSGREHGATLLHYTAANGVEEFRQRTPANVVEIAAMLLEAGAEVDATARFYGADCTALELAATSGHPERAGVQIALLELLLEHGAVVESSLVRACLGNGRVRAAEFLAERLEERGLAVGFAAAAGLGRLDWVEAYFAADGNRRPDVADAELQEGFRFACQFGREAMAVFLLERGAEIGSADALGQTALHRAAIGGHPGTVRRLLAYDPPLEAVNSYGGTVLGQALWSAAHGGDAEVYVEILEALVGAGARVPERHAPVNPAIDRWLEARGSHAEPEWRWFGEEN